MSMRRVYPNPYQGQQTGMATTQEMLEQENDQLVDTLKDKVSALRTLSIDIGDEVKRHNTLLTDMDKEFDSTGGLLSGSMKRLKGLAQGGHNRWMCYMILVILFIFIVLYFVVKWRK